MRQYLRGLSRTQQGGWMFRGWSDCVEICPIQKHGRLLHDSTTEEHRRASRYCSFAGVGVQHTRATTPTWLGYRRGEGQGGVWVGEAE